MGLASLTILTGSQTEDVASISANAEQEFTVTVTGARTGNVALVSAPSLESGGVATAYVSAADTVTVRVSNVTEGALNPASQTFYVAVIQ
jgi:hypothetical protein